MAGKTVCVTGAGGFIASWLVKELLHRGYTVRGTVRDPSNPRKTQHLQSLEGAPERLSLHQADLLQPGSFDDVIRGCHAVFHTASPFFTANVTDPQAQLLDPAVKGTENVLASCAKFKDTVARVVLTSSTAAVAYDPNRPKDRPINEGDWSNADVCRANKQWYVLSKTLAERTAWDLASKHGLDLVTMNPAMVVGDLLQPEMNTSSEFVLHNLNGQNKTIGNWGVGWVHVEDVALAHVLGLERPEAKGRYLLVKEWAPMATLCEELRKIEPTAPVPTELGPGSPLVPLTFDTSKAEALGVVFKPLSTMVKDAVKGLREKGFLSH